MHKYEINLKMEFKTRPSKIEVENKLFDILKNGFTLRTADEADDYVRRKVIKEKNERKTN